jgi:hypothetical protein
MAEPTHPTEPVTKAGIKLPLWVWAVGSAVVVGVGYFLYKRKSAANAAAANTAGTGTGGTPGLYTNPVAILPIFQGTGSPVPSNPIPQAPPGHYNGPYRSGPFIMPAGQFPLVDGPGGATIRADLLNAYGTNATLYGHPGASGMSYAYVGPGNIQAIPLSA